MHDSYLLIANQLRDFHHNLHEHILNDTKNRPKWTLDEKGRIEQIYPLLILADLLEKLGGNVNSIESRLSDMEKALTLSLEGQSIAE